VPARRLHKPPAPSAVAVTVPAVRRAVEEVPRVLKKLALAAVAAGALAVVRKRSSGKAEADLWHEATRGPDAVSTPTNR
jgi:hypothetical protein